MAEHTWTNPAYSLEHGEVMELPEALGESELLDNGIIGGRRNYALELAFKIASQSDSAKDVVESAKIFEAYLKGEGTGG